ncbi:MAG: hypothetical protein J5982_05305 [Bacilli bacterium]|nr:hypothetical protein [Bacilli bacterium]
MEEIDINQLLSYFKSKIIYIIFAMAISFCLACIYVNKFRVPEYTSFTTVLLNQANDSEQINATQVDLNRKLISTYNEIIKSKKILNQVIDKLSLDYTYYDLVGKINVGEVGDTSIIKISVTDTDSTLAAEIANTIADVFSQEIVTIYNIKNISTIDKAEPSLIASSTSTIKIIGVSTVAGAFISIAIIFILFYFDTTLKNEEDIERITGLPVIGMVPASREKIKYSQHRKYYDDLAKHHKNQNIVPIERKIREVEAINPIETSDSELGSKVVSKHDNSLDLDSNKKVESAIKDDLTKIKIEALENENSNRKTTNSRVSNNNKKSYYKTAKTTNKK